MKHDYLVEHAARWLRRTCQCVIVLTERGRRGEEHPDAIGWRADGFCILIECKRTRKDFVAEWVRTDRKQFRLGAANGMGNRRLYLAPAGVLDPQMVAQRGWGLVESYPRKTILLLESMPFPSNREAELRLILAQYSKVHRERKTTQLRFGFPNQW